MASLKFSAKNLTEVDYLNIWNFEKNEPFLTASQDWLESNQSTIIYLIIFYICSTFSAKRFMRDKKPFDLTKALVAWNFLLAAFSVIGFMRTVPEIIYLLKRKNGFHNTVCSRNNGNYATLFWGLMMTASKVAEFGDTAFVILKKKPLTFLNWGHHSVALLMTAHFFTRSDAMARWFMVMNYFVHAFMYTYFGLKTLKFDLPRVTAVIITIIQLLQMVMGSVVSGYAMFNIFYGRSCDVYPLHAWLGAIFYPMFVYLFASLFYRSYLKNPIKANASKTK